VSDSPEIGDDDCVCKLVEDKQGRIWAGTRAHGVAVWNGRGWKTFGPLEGPIGEHIFALATNPDNGDVWIASNGGLSCYSTGTETWRHFTRAQGLESDQITALATNSRGDVYAGTLASGLMIAKNAEDYANWRVIAGPPAPPLLPSGEGLPSSQINAVLATRDDTIWVATVAGLAQSSDAGATWKYLRGGDWKAKIEGLAHQPASLPTPPISNRELLSEDYLTTLAADGRGLLWAGTRSHGLQIRRPLTDRVLFDTEKSGNGPSAPISSLIPFSDGSFLVGFYGSGLVSGPATPNYTPTQAEVEAEAIAQRRGSKLSPPPSMRNVAFPAPQVAPGVAELQSLTQKIAALQTPLAPGAGTFLGEDWRTQGDWIGRYGRRRAILCATTAPFDSMFAGQFPLPDAIAQLGPHSKNSDSIRRWLRWIKTDKRATLYNPELGYRRQAEWDDHGEAYPPTFEGPDLWISLEIPAGTWRVSSYFFNPPNFFVKPGQTGSNRERDHLLELRSQSSPLPPWPSPPQDGKITAESMTKDFGAYYAAREKLIEKSLQTPPLAQTRVRDFWGGVHKQFVVQGPANYWLHIAKNYSLNTIVSSVMFDEITPGKRWEDAPHLAWMGQGTYNPPDPDAPEPIDPFLLDKILDGSYHPPGAPTEAQKQQQAIVSAARELWNASDAAMDKVGGANWQWLARLMAYRAASANGAPEKLLERWRWKMPLWTPADTQKWNESMVKAYDFYTDLNPELKNANF